MTTLDAATTPTGVRDLPGASTRPTGALGAPPGPPTTRRTAGEWTVVTARVQSLVLRPRGATAAFEVDIDDGQGMVTLIWLGRRLIRGIDTGRWVRAEGRVMRTARGATLYNPIYTLLAGEPSAVPTDRRPRRP